MTKDKSEIDDQEIIRFISIVKYDNGQIQYDFFSMSRISLRRMQLDGYFVDGVNFTFTIYWPGRRD